MGGQWKGDSTVEGYIRALLQGARSVELDCWDGPNNVPQITHGRTLTSRVPFQDVVSAIARYAFVTSPYPLILSFEVHADPPQQEVMARILKDTLGDMLLSQPLLRVLFSVPMMSFPPLKNSNSRYWSRPRTSLLLIVSAHYKRTAPAKTVSML